MFDTFYVLSKQGDNAHDVLLQIVRF